MPRFLNAWLKTAFTGSRKLYFVFTSDAYAGISGFQGKLLARRRRMKHVGRAELKPRNYNANDAYPKLSQSEIEERIKDASARMHTLTDMIRLGWKLFSLHGLNKELFRRCH